MGRLLLIDALSASALLVVWYSLLAWYNRRKGARALQWLEAACMGKGRIVEAQWSGPCRLQARLRFAANWLENPRITVRLLPRPVPIQWLLSISRKQKETLTFEADLDSVPTFQLEVYRHRWLTHRHTRMIGKGAKQWSVSRPGPVVLTTRTHWNQELTPVVNTLMTSRGHNLVTVRFRPDSPHLAATVTLDSVSGEQAVANFLNTVHDLATGASARQ